MPAPWPVPTMSRLVLRRCRDSTEPFARRRPPQPRSQSGSAVRAGTPAPKPSSRVWSGSAGWAANIGIDLRPLQTEHRYRGIGVYLAELIAAIAAIDQHNAYVFYAFAGAGADALEGIPLSPRIFHYLTVEVPRPFAGIQLTHLRDAVFQSLSVYCTGLMCSWQPTAPSACRAAVSHGRRWV